METFPLVWGFPIVSAEDNKWRQRPFRKAGVQTSSSYLVESHEMGSGEGRVYVDIHKSSTTNY